MDYVGALRRLERAIVSRALEDVRAIRSDAAEARVHEDEAGIKQMVHELCAGAEGMLTGDAHGVYGSLLGAGALASLSYEEFPPDVRDCLLGVAEAMFAAAPDNLPAAAFLAMRLYDRRSDRACRERAILVMQDLVGRIEAPDANAETGIEVAGLPLWLLQDMLAELLFLGRDVRKAAEHGRRAIELSPEDASEDCYIAQALEAADRLDFKSALDFAARIREYTTPTRRFFVESQRARWLCHSGRAAEAMAELEALETSPGVFPDNPWIRELILARSEACCELTRDLDWVVGACSDLLRSDTGDFQVRVRLANALARAGRLDESKEQVDYLISLAEPDFVLYFTAGVLYKLLGIRAKERDAAFFELDALYGKAARYMEGNDELHFMRGLEEEQLGYIGHLWGEAIYAEAARLGNGGNMQAALDLLHQRERRAFVADLKDWIILGLAETYTVLSQDHRIPDYRRWAFHYVDALAQASGIDQSAVAELRSRLT